MKVANRILRPSKKSFQCTTLSAIIMRRLPRDRKSTRLNSSHGYISYAVFCLKKKKKKRLSRCADSPIHSQLRSYWSMREYSVHSTDDCTCGSRSSVYICSTCCTCHCCNCTC